MKVDDWYDYDDDEYFDSCEYDQEDIMYGSDVDMNG